MQFEIKLNKAKFRNLDNALKKAPKELSNAIARGLTTGLHATAGVVKRRVGNSSILKRRSGALTGAVKAYKDNKDDLYGYIGVGDDQDVAPYAWLLGRRDTKTITAKAGGLLAIPVGNALTEAGVPRYGSPRDVPDGFWFTNPKTNKILFGRNVGGQLDILFVGKESVSVKSTGILPEIIEERMPNMEKSIEKEIAKTIKKLGLD
ncbi:MAG: hypothetical protein GY841_04500 [FCB group bacterium]|nr:hypothetical protein [FCB group bacterium]